MRPYDRQTALVNREDALVIITNIQFDDVVVDSRKTRDNRTRKKMFINLAIIPSLYFISTGLSFLSFDVAVIFPVIMIPSLRLAAKVHHKYKYDNHN